MTRWTRRASARSPLTAGALAYTALLTASLATAQTGPDVPADVALQNIQWPAYGGDAGGTRYSDQRQIDRTNVGQLKVAWQYRTGELGQGFKSADKMAFEATPILANGFLYLSTPTNIVVAIDPSTGKQRWRYDPRIPRDSH
ncbi:MAG TPA: hypothetical protein VK629_08580, partial [Steroidobacteraceae bacterium]|nr:hypothetical protein [Steroidobacteraceae bacterium]